MFAITSLAVVLFAVRWAAREFPISEHYVSQSGVWIDDNYLLVSQHSKSYGNWDASTKHFLIDCSKNSWTDLGQMLGIDDFSAQHVFRTSDGHVFLPRQSEHMDGIKLNPSTLEIEEIQPVGSRSFTVVGNQYLLSTEDGQFCCRNLVDNSTTLSSVPNLNQRILPIPGEPCFLVQHTHTQFGPTGNLQALDVHFQTTVEDREIQDEAKARGVSPSEIILLVLYEIVDNQPKIADRWYVRKTISNRSAQVSDGLIALVSFDRAKVDIHSGENGRLLQSFDVPSQSKGASDVRYEFGEGVILFRDSAFNVVSALDARSGDAFTVEDQVQNLLMGPSEYFVTHVRNYNTWPAQVRKRPSGQVVIDDLNSLTRSCLDFTSDGKSLKFLTEQDSVHFLDLESGQERNLKPRANRVRLCYLAWAALGAWIFLWILGCHQLGLPMIVQTTVTVAIILLVGYWRLTLANTDWIDVRPAFTALMGLAIWIGLKVVAWITAKPIPLVAQIFFVQILIYLWYWLVFSPKGTYLGSDRYVYETIAVVLAASTVTILRQALSSIIRATDQQANFRFTITNIGIVTLICAVFAHQFKLIQWNYVVQFGGQATFIWMAIFVLAMVAGWLASRIGRYPRTSIVVALSIIGIFASWNSMVAYALPRGRAFDWWASLGYSVQMPFLFVGPIIVAGLNFRQPDLRSKELPSGS